MYLMGHRGAKGEAPENTLASFKHLHNLGIQRVEFDLRLSADDDIVIIHDDTLERTTNGSGLVRETSTEALNNLDACGYFDEQLPKEGVPSLKEVLSVFDNLLDAQLEVKPLPEADHELMCSEIARTLKELSLEQVCTVTSSDVAFLESCKRFCPHLSRGYIFFEPEYKPFEVCAEQECELLAIYWRFCSKEVIDKAHDMGLKISAWTVNETEDFENLVSLGIDSIITDFPTKMLPLKK